MDVRHFVLEKNNIKMDLKKFIDKVKPYSMTSVERITELYNSLEYIRINNIDGEKLYLLSNYYLIYHSQRHITEIKLCMIHKLMERV